ncbi:MAG: Fe-S cluster assembly ATPase SufC [Pseudomonadota bacterium]|nr:Fe-S cluster assembly ATPase SufC [Pseudomonadota bacterium]
MLKISDLHASVGDKSILKGIDLTVSTGQVHAIMGPNGSGKSTLSNVLAGHPDYTVTKGDALLDGADLLSMTPEERAARGVFLAFQYPVELPGVPSMTFLKTALNSQRTARGQMPLSSGEFIKEVKRVACDLDMSTDLLRRPVNVGFSGGEKKRNEIMQMALMSPKLAILDETDSGLDIDALKIVADGVNALRSPDRAILIITHYHRILEYIVPDVVHVLVNGRICRSGGRELALELEAKGYAEFGSRESAA